jgi:hypothetical protein
MKLIADWGVHSSRRHRLLAIGCMHCRGPVAWSGTTPAQVENRSSCPAAARRTITTSPASEVLDPVRASQ